MTLPPVTGHEPARSTFAGAHARDSLPAALLIHGLAGTGKQRIALWLGQLLHCEIPNARGPCARCRACRMAVRVQHPDLHWFFPLPRPKRASGAERMVAALEEARAAALEAIRRTPLRPTHSDQPRGIYLGAVTTIRRMALKRPSLGERQVFIIGNAEELIPQEASDQAANALLKLLEEPPAGTTFILTSSEPGRLLPTIRSRTVPFHLGPLPVEQVERFLVEAAGAPAADAHLAAALSRGSIGRALAYLPADGEPGPLEHERVRARRLLEAALDGGIGAAATAASRVGVSGARGLLGVFGALEDWLRDLAAVATGAPALNQDAGPFLERAVARRSIHPEGVARAVAEVEQAKHLAASNVNPQLLVYGMVRDASAALETRT
ncbi:MAG: hypothetical protein OXN92_08510 [Gammaproteobacteria bacterium]|nr:hypothetical protein [Gammaproteobacteria bacterium]